MAFDGPLRGPDRVYPPAPFKRAPALGRRPRGRWPAATRRWWEAVSSLPHAADWTAGDWEFARTSATVHALVVERPTAALLAELRVREERLGATEAGRLRLHIRYEAEPDKPKGRKRSAAELRLVKDDAVSS